MLGLPIHRLVVVTAAALVAGLVVRTPVHGQDPVSVASLNAPSAPATLRAAVELVSSDRLDEASRILDGLVVHAPTYVSPTHGAAAYWQGTVLARRGQPDRARRAWADGLDAFHASNRAPPTRLLDAYLQALPDAEAIADLDRARRAYLTLLGRVRPGAPPSEQAVFRRHVAQVAPLLDDDTLARIIRESRLSDASTWTFRAESGSAMQAWWRRQDPHPSTAVNERLNEHLRRLARAQAAYACPSRVSRLDDRGHAYLRYGAPAKRHSVTYNDGKFYQEVVRFGVAVSPSDFPENELWTYPHIDPSAYYLFAKPRQCFVTAQANDLLPKHLRQRRGSSDRGLNIAYSALMAMRYIYHNLAMFHPDFSARFTDVAKYADWQTTRASVAEARAATGGGRQGGRSVGGGMGQERRVYANPQMGIDPPNRFVSQMVRRARREDEAAAKRRKEVMPRQYSERSSPAPLPVAVRTARVLTPGGSTRVAVSWGLRPEALDAAASDTSRGALIRFSGVRYDAAYRRQADVAQQYVIENDAGRRDSVLQPQAVTIPGRAAPYHIALQWLQFDAYAPPEGIVDVGAFRRETTVRVDSVQPLRAEGRRLEMSDLQVRTLPTPDAPPAAWEDASAPYPFDAITPTTPLLLHFELYHLTFGADDRTRYTIDYAVETKTDDGWEDVPGAGAGDAVSTRATYGGASRRTREFIALDLTALDLTPGRALRVAVRVTDETTGARAERAVTFTVAEAAAQGDL